jgi:3-methyl-2-oxobutanoate hydroxymethyltransferase
MRLDNMSTNIEIEKITIPDILTKKKNNEKIAALTAYDFLMAEMLDEAGIDIILIGDSVGMVVSGYSTTLPVTMDQMIYHAKIVSRVVKRALVVVDMPFLSYQTSIERGIENAGRFLKETESQAVKLEGGETVVDLVRRLVSNGIPVMGHIGLVPQSIHRFGSYKLQGKDPKIAKQLRRDAKLLEEAGVFSIVLEKIPAILSKEISESVSIPTIGIGAGPFCDGQILVSHDLLGIYDKFKPRFVRRYANLAKDMRKAFRSYLKDVRSGSFPSEEEYFK